MKTRFLALTMGALMITGAAQAAQPAAAPAAPAAAAPAPLAPPVDQLAWKIAGVATDKVACRSRSPR
jgi:hypothetical protein